MTRCSECGATVRQDNEASRLCDPCRRKGQRTGLHTLLGKMLSGGVRGRGRCAEPRWASLGLTDAMFFPDMGPEQRAQAQAWAREWGITHIEAGSPQTQRATALCFSCPVQRECLRVGLQEENQVGIWGGIRAVARQRHRSMAQHNMEDVLDTLLTKGRREAAMLGLTGKEGAA